MDSRTDPLLRAFERRRSDLRRLLASRVGDAGEVDDLLQDLYLRLATGRVAEEVRDAEAYCFRLAYNLAVDRRRALTRRRRREEVWGLETETFVGQTPVLAEPSAEDVVSSRQQLEAVLSAVERLPPRSREVFRMHKLDGLSYAEVARRLGVSVSAVEKGMMRALAAIASVVQR